MSRQKHDKTPEEWFEDEDLAIALSLSLQEMAKEDERDNYSSGRSLYQKTVSPHSLKSSGFESSSAEPKPLSICAECNQPISSGRYVIIRGKRYHSDCFLCAGCNEAVSERIEFYGDPPLPYHLSCAKILFHNTRPKEVSSKEVQKQFRKPSAKRPTSNRMKSSSPSVVTCATCLKSISVGKSYSECQGKSYHENCFRCRSCHQLLSERVRFEDNIPYCLQCAKNLFNSCCVCSKVIDGERAKLPILENDIYCLDHADIMKFCHACFRKEPFCTTNKEPFIHFPDGRSLCPKCSETVIMDSQEAKLLFERIIEFMEIELGLEIPFEMRSVPVLAVDSQAIDENRSQITGHEHPQLPMTRGLTLSTIGAISYKNGKESSLFRFEQVRDVTAVLVLYGLPHDLFASVLAHEATHAYVKLSKHLPYNLPSQVEEGICQLVAYKYLDHLKMMKLKEGKVGNGSKDELDYFKYQISEDKSEVYGAGFQMAQKAEKELGGFRTLLDHVAVFKAFP